MTTVIRDSQQLHNRVKTPKKTPMGDLVSDTSLQFVDKEDGIDFWWRIRGYLNPGDDATVRVVLTISYSSGHRASMIRVSGTLGRSKVVGVKQPVGQLCYAFHSVEFEGSGDVTVIPSIPKEFFLEMRTQGKATLTFEIGDMACKHFAKSTIADCFTTAAHYVSDFKIVVGKEHLKVHRHFMSMISPVFHATINENPQTGFITIDDFDVSTVKNTIDFCYGRSEKKTVEEVIQMLKFAHKYKIKIVIERFTDHLERVMTEENFSAIVLYAWEVGKSLMTKCVEFYRYFHSSITLTKEFVELPVQLRDIIIDHAVGMKIIDEMTCVSAFVM